MQRVYLDNNATSAMDPAVVSAMLPYFSEHFGNPSSLHSFGAPIAEAVRHARRAVRDLLGAALDQEVIFTSGGSESDNAAIFSALKTKSGRNEVVVSAVEHSAVLNLCSYLEKHRAVRVRRIAVDANGRLDIDAYRAALGPKTAIASIMWANNETGTLFDVATLADIAHQAGALFHTDAVQAVGKRPLDIKTTPIDMLSLSAHKFHGPKGIGALYVRKGLAFSPLIHGGKQERGRRGGTENVPAIIGLGKAAELASQHLAEALVQMRDLRDRLERGIVQRIGDCWVIGDVRARLTNTTNLVFNCAAAEPILVGLDKAGVAASSGSACTSGSMEPSHVIRAMGVPFSAAHGAIRFSLSRYNTAEDVDYVIAVLPDIVARARDVSLFANDHATTKHESLRSH